MKDSQPHHNPWLERIASYLREHPNASDSAEGVARWWVHAPIAQWPQVRRALDLMVGDGLLECYAATDGRKRYRLPASPGRMPAP